MAEQRGSPLSPSVTKGALVQLVEDLGIVVPNIIPFQYNPDAVTRSLKPWDPFEVDQTARGANAPTTQPYAPEEDYKFKIVFDATDGLDEGDPLVQATGVAARIAALQKLTEPTAGLFGDLIASASALAGGPQKNAVRPTVPITLLAMGPGLIVPVRLTSISIEIKEYTPQLYPHLAEVSLDLRVLTPEVFKCASGPAIDIAVAAYNLTKLQDDALAVLHIASAVKASKSILPF